MIHRVILVLILVAAVLACQGKTLLLYQDPSGEFSVEVPRAWRRDGNESLARRPVALVSFIGEVQTQDEGNLLGALIHVTRVSRVRSEFPGNDKAFQAFAEAWLIPSDVLFGASRERLPADVRNNLPEVREASLGGRSARTYRRDYDYFNRLHMPAAVPMRLEDVVVRTDRAYYIIEYRATRALFEKHLPVFERFKQTFVFGPRFSPDPKKKNRHEEKNE